MATKLMMQESFTNETKGHVIGESDWYEPFTNDRGRLFRDCQKDYGRCVSKVYVDMPDGTVKTTGWYFERREAYEDSGRYGRPVNHYTRGVWVQLVDVEEEDFDA